MTDATMEPRAFTKEEVLSLAKHAYEEGVADFGYRNTDEHGLKERMDSEGDRRMDRNGSDE